jgi:positive regulator of sigma E activity
LVPVPRRSHYSLKGVFDMNKILNKIANLINVKSIVTLILVTIFSILSVKESITAEQFVSIFTVVIAFYFGTRYEKKSKNNLEEGE